MKILAATPDKMDPATKPMGFPALKHAKALFFLWEGRSYAAPRIPIAGGTVAAAQSPINPQKTSIYMAFVAKPAIRAETANAPMENIKRLRRPKVSATLAKKRRKAPEVSLYHGISYSRSIAQVWATYAALACTQVISALVMFNVVAMGAVITLQAPFKSVPMARDIVAVKTKRHSCIVEVKHFGR